MNISPTEMRSSAGQLAPSNGQMSTAELESNACPDGTVGQELLTNLEVLIDAQRKRLSRQSHKAAKLSSRSSYLHEAARHRVDRAKRHLQYLLQIKTVMLCAVSETNGTGH